MLYKKIEDLIKYLDPQYIDRIVPDAMKLQFILTGDLSRLSPVVGMCKSIVSSGVVPDSYWSAPDHAAKLQGLAQIHIQQQAEIPMA
ncbi:dynactin subunit 3 isoform X3 [Natator depressus]|uniref:dynactin subunit 3 isoform X3 n=1 Tax=Natator depressus TaxID=27790 RepID=UPI003EBF71A6